MGTPRISPSQPTARREPRPPIDGCHPKGSCSLPQEKFAGQPLLLDCPAIAGSCGLFPFVAKGLVIGYFTTSSSPADSLLSLPRPCGRTMAKPGVLCTTTKSPTGCLPVKA